MKKYEGKKQQQQQPKCVHDGCSFCVRFSLFFLSFYPCSYVSRNWFEHMKGGRGHWRNGSIRISLWYKYTNTYIHTVTHRGVLISHASQHAHTINTISFSARLRRVRLPEWWTFANNQLICIHFVGLHIFHRLIFIWFEFIWRTRGRVRLLFEILYSNHLFAFLWFM